MNKSIGIVGLGRVGMVAAEKFIKQDIRSSVMPGDRKSSPSLKNWAEFI